MEESLKTGRFIHRLLLSACAISLAFAAVPAEELAIDAALREIDLLFEIDPDVFAKEEADQLPAVRQYRALLHQIFHDAGLQQEGSDADVFPLETKYGYRPGPGVSLEDFREYFMSPQSGFLKVPKFTQQLQAELPGKLTALVPASPDDVNSEDVQPTVFTSVTVRNAKPLNLGYSGSMAVHTEQSIPLVVLSKPIEFDFPSFEVDFITQLRAHEEFSPLVSGDAEDEKIFPALDEFWSELRYQPVPKCRDILIKRRTEVKQNLSFFGFSVPGRLAVLAVPLVLLFLMLYLLAHLYHIGTIATGPDRTFPWMVIFSGRFGRLLADASIVVFPLIANGQVVWRSWEVAGTPYLVAGITATAGGLAASVFAWIQIRKLRGETPTPADVDS